MALALGTENKRQVIIASVLGVILVICGFFVFHMFFGSSSPSDSGPVPAAPSVQNPPAPAAAQSGATSSSSHRIRQRSAAAFERRHRSRTAFRQAGPKRRCRILRLGPQHLLRRLRPRLDPQAHRADSPQRLTPARAKHAARAPQASGHRSPLLRLLSGRAQTAQGLFHAR